MQIFWTFYMKRQFSKTRPLRPPSSKEDKKMITIYFAPTPTNKLSPSGLAVSLFMYPGRRL